MRAAIEKATCPLCVDLDGTLIKTDLVWESLVRLLRHNPLYSFLVPVWLLGGRARLKERIAQRVDVDPTSLPYHQPVLDYVREEHRQGRQIILATACDQRLAQRVADYVGLFREVLASDGKTNLRGKNKGATLAERFGEHGFDYAGNSSVDLPVWERARQAIVVSGSPRLQAQAEERSTIGRVFAISTSFWSVLFQALRPQRWIKNLLVFVPLVTAYRLAELPVVLKAIGAFIAFSICASGVYILDDLWNLDADRHHPTKRLRPFASGDLPLPVGLALFPLLLAAGILLAAQISWSLAAVLGIYIPLCTTYFWRLKQIVLVNVFCLAALYTIRLIGGHEATGVDYSFWLLVLSMFIFLSLALVKRFLELHAARRDSKPDIRGRSVD